MSFLAPLFALGALAIVGPILFHLIRRTTKDVTPFSTLMFLQPSPPRITRRSRLENLWLLLLRCLVIALLAAAFARPFLPAVIAPPIAGAGTRTVILLDASASMRREKLWDEVRSRAMARVRAARPGDDLALIVFDRESRAVLGFEEWRRTPSGQRLALAGQRLAALAPGWAATHLDTALLGSVEMLDEKETPPPARREIIVITDLQEGARLNGLQGFRWPRGLSVTLETVASPAMHNASAHWISESEQAEHPGEETSLRLRVTNSTAAPRDQLPLSWSGLPAIAPIAAYVPAGQSRVVRVPHPPARATALELRGDSIAFDNTLHLLAPQAAHTPLLFLGADADEDTRSSLYYLRRAFPRTARQHVEITAHRSEQAVPAFQLQQAQLLVLGDAVAAAPLASARRFAQEGRFVVAQLHSTATAQTLARLLEIPALPASEAVVKDYALLAQIDFQHPLFAAFADPRFSDFTKIHWWKYRRLDPAALAGARVLARFDSGDPAILQMPLGKGSVILFTSTWRPADSELALSSKFVPLLHALLEQSSRLPPQKAQYFIGESVPLATGSQPLTIRRPGGGEEAATAGAKFSGTDEPGIYTVNPGGMRFAVNLPPEESRLAVLPPDRLTSLGVPLRTGRETPAELARREGEAQAAEIESQQKLWRWLLVAVLGLLLLETVFAGKLSRPAGQPVQP